MKTPRHIILLAYFGCLSLMGSVQAATLSLADSPLYLTNRADPNVLIDLSIESPMVGAAYNDQSDTASGGSCTGRPATEGGYNIGTCYFNTKTYLGYFDPLKCYTYTSSRFEPSGATSATHECTSKWSGNFLNWVSMTAIDEFRWALTGGYRSSDSATLTVLERANETLSKGHTWYPVKKVKATINVAPSTVTPYSNTTLYIYNHGTQIDVGTTTAANENATNLNVRVKVCDSTAGLETNCKAYGTSNKPEGLIQANWDRMRFAVTSYLLDNSQSRDGGVLRSKMKYTGPQKYVVGTGMVTNSNNEWSATDGTFITNPDPTDATASGVTNSGVINYINKFGANGYKSYDPAGELFYEAIRYFKNLGPTPEYSSSLTAAMKDSFPVITTWDDPIQFRCQKNFIVGINDANPWLDKKLPGTFFTTATITGAASSTVTLTASDYGPPSNPDPDINVTTLTNTVGALEGLNGTSWVSSGTWTSGTASGTLDGIGGGVGTYDTNCSTAKTVANLGEVMGTCSYTPKENSYYIAGLAYYANTNDIRSSFTGTQTIATYMIDTQEYATNPLDGPRNMLWLAGKYGGFIDSNNNNIPDLASEWDADGDGVPDNYVLATQPDKLVSGLSAAFLNIIARTGSSASVATNSTSLLSGSNIYQAKFNSGEWYGELIAYPISTAGVIGTAAWNAGTKLASPTSTTRIIITYNPTTADGVSFRWASLTAAQQTAIQGADSVATAQSRLDYLRGDASNEGTASTNFRRRPTSKLGDIVNSSPQYVGDPSGQYELPQFLLNAYVTDSSYLTFRTANLGRKPVIYAGANDGMLHGFNACSPVGVGCTAADQGTELLAYVPSSVYSNLRSLSLQGYTHKYFVDGSPTVADALVSSSWKTVLVGGLNAGGRGVFALDVTNPSIFSETNATSIVLWEFNDSHDTDMGYTYAKPLIAKMNNGKWAAIVGNGYNSANGKAKLFILYIEEGVDGTWNASDFVKIDTKAGSVSLPNGLASVNAIDRDGDGDVDTLYAGDLLGNMWKFDVSDSNDNNWNVAFGTTAAPLPLFTACSGACSGSNYQPITTRPEVSFHPTNLNTIMVYFGTGKYIEPNDPNTTATQTFYGIWDNNATVSGRSTLLPQTFTTTTISGSDYRIPTNTAIDWTTHKGWYEDLPDTGERHVGNPKLVNGIMFYNTFIPTTDPCDYGGTGYLMAVNSENGGLPSLPVFDTNNTGTFTSADTLVGGKKIGGALGGTTIITPGSGTTPGVAVSSLTDGQTGSDIINPAAIQGYRISWRELLDE